MAAEPVSKCLRRAGCAGDVDNGYVDVGGDDRVTEEKSMEVGVTGGDGVKIAVERYITGFSSFIDKSGADVLDMDLKNGGGIEAQASDVKRN